MKHYSFFSYIVLMLVLFCIPTEVVHSHGTFTTPVSRIYNCFLENPENPTSDSCKEAVAVGGKQALYDWNGVNQGNANDMHMEVVPDGQLCGAGKELFKGMNLARDDWFTNNISPNQDGSIDFVFRATAPHSTKYFDFYITKEGYNPLEPLKWSDLESSPFCSISEVELENGNYNMNCPFPSGKSGKHVIYNIWQRDDSQEAFYTCIDVNIEGDDTGGETGYKTIGSITANQDLSPGDKVKFRLFDENFTDIETITKKLNEKNYTADKWPFVLAKKINRKSLNAKAGVLNGEEIKPVKSPDENKVYISVDSNYSFQIDIEMVNNPGGDDDDDDCSCEPSGNGNSDEFDFTYPESLGSYQEGNVVKGTDGNLYECRTFPNSGWCNGDSFFYEPGSGVAWQDAWIKIN